MPEKPTPNEYENVSEEELEHRYAAGDLVAGVRLWQIHEQQLDAAARRYSGGQKQVVADALRATRDKIERKEVCQEAGSSGDFETAEATDHSRSTSSKVGSPIPVFAQFAKRHAEGTRWYPWVLVILKHETFAEFRRWKRHGLRGEGRNALEVVTEDDHSTHYDDAEAVRYCLNALPDDEREILRDRYFFAKKFAEIAEKRGRTAQAEHARLKRALGKLKRCLEKQGFEDKTNERID